MKTTLILLLTSVISLNTVFAQENKLKDNTQNAYEMPRTQVIPINSSETKAQDTLYIKLPEGYVENNDIEYPVIYFTHPVQHIEILSALTENLIEDVILVGIPWQKGRMKFKEDQNSYVNFIRNDVFKTIENNYRTDPDNRTYFGYSFGALVGAYILSKHPNTFKNFILGSPAFGYDPAVKQKIYEFGSNTTNKRKELNANVFVSYGTSEKEEAKQHFKEFITILENLNDESLTFEHIVVEGNHQTAFPPTALRSVTWLASLLKDGDFPVLGGPYFGQKPPGLIPEVFAPGIVSINGRHEGVASFSPDLNEIYFNADNKDQETHIYFSRLEDNKWAPIDKTDFTQGKIDEEIHPFVSPDGKRIYFTALSSDFTYNKIWYVNRLTNGWSSAKILESPVNHDQVFYPNQSVDGDLYYFNISKSQTYRASGDRNTFSKIEPVEIEFGVHAFIAPSQDYLVLNDRNKEDENRKDNDIYVSFKRENGTWTKPINLGDEVNSNRDDRAPTISPDGKYLFFGRDEEEGGREADIYWVSTEVIENLRPK